MKFKQILWYITITAAFFLIGATAAYAVESPSVYAEGKAYYQHDRGSDWMLRPERSYIDDRNNPRYHLHLGLEWARQIKCPFVSTGTDALEWVHVGCSKDWDWWEGEHVTIGFQLALIHQIDRWSNYYLRTDKHDLTPPDPQAQRWADSGARWTGQNPFYHMRLRFKWDDWSVNLVTGRSLTQGFPMEKETNSDGSTEPDLYWSGVELVYQWGGK